MKKKNSKLDWRFTVWMVEVKLDDGGWQAFCDVPARERRGSALRAAYDFAHERKFSWMLTLDGLYVSHRVRARKYYPLDGPKP